MSHKGAITNDPHWPNLPPDDDVRGSLQIRRAPRFIDVESERQHIWKMALAAAAKYIVDEDEKLEASDYICISRLAREILLLEMPTK